MNSLVEARHFFHPKGFMMNKVVFLLFNKWTRYSFTFEKMLFYLIIAQHKYVIKSANN